MRNRTATYAVGLWPSSSSLPRRKEVKIVLAVALLAISVSAQTNLLQNGSFETGPTIPSTQTELTITPTGPDQIPGWSVFSGNVDYLSEFWTPSDGNPPGSIEFTDTTAAGNFAVAPLEPSVDGWSSPRTRFRVSRVSR